LDLWRREKERTDVGEEGEFNTSDSRLAEAHGGTIENCKKGGVSAKCEKGCKWGRKACGKKLGGRRGAGRQWLLLSGSTITKAAYVEPKKAGEGGEAKDGGDCRGKKCGRGREEGGVKKG